MAIVQTKTKTIKKPLVGRPLGGAIGAYADMEKKAKAGDPQAQADLKLEKSRYKEFADGPGSGPSGGWPTPKKKMGGKVVKKAKNGFDLNKDGKTTFKDVLIGRGVLPKKAKAGAKVKKAMMGSSMTSAPIMKKGGAVKKCKYGCK